MSNVSGLDQLEIGAALPPLVFGPISRHTLALYCGGSGDHNPIHVDIDFAREAGMGDVFAHGMLSMAVLSRLLTEWIPQQRIRDYGVRFVAITPVNATLKCEGTVVEKFQSSGEQRVRIELVTKTDDGTITLTGSATVAIV